MSGFDAVLLHDAADTITGDVARQAAFDSCKKAWEFYSSCSELARAVEEKCDSTR